jgi:phage repressor protein C with HTH and peptisase S24 domain
LPGTIEQPQAVSIGATRQGTYVVLEAELPERAARPIGVLLIDPATDRGWVRLRPYFEDLTDDTEVLDALADDLRIRIAECGAEAFLQSLEDTLSNVVRVGERQSVAVDAFTRVVERLFAEHVDEPVVQPFVTHVPVYSLRAAAGSLGEEMQVAAEDWVPAPEGMRLSNDLFVAHVVGRSMEPRIPDGSLNLFRLHPAGSRQGKILLIERFGIADQSARYTVKRYTSVKRQLSEDEWEHERIRLEPLNPEFEPWDVEPQDFAVVAEWLRVIE